MGPLFFSIGVIMHSPLTLIAAAVIGFFLAWMWWVVTQALERAWTEADDLEQQFGPDVIAAFKYKFLGGRGRRG